MYVPRCLLALQMNTASYASLCNKQPDDPKADEDCLGCLKCKSWFHLSRAEGYSVLDDENFICRPCFA